MVRIKNLKLAAFLVVFFSFILLLTPTLVEAATLVNTFRITDEGSQQKDPFVFNNIVAYSSLGDIWGYNLDTRENYPILEDRKSVV